MTSVLIANRGEIALRIVRACRELGLRSVAVYSEADRTAPHVQHADEAYLLGPAPSSESYLRGDRIVELALEAGVDAVHPGYGFLAERPTFARMIEEAGLIFVGPTSDTIAAMGDKASARRRMASAGVPIIPGAQDPLRDEEAAAAVAKEIGFPVLLKAVAGGGGKGMRLVEDEAELPKALESVRREAAGAFGDDAVYLEKHLDRPRHVEIQVLGDGQGGVVHLGERECSIQRRHQKLVEEAPSPALTPEMREAMGEAAVRAAHAVNYRGAGTVEFLLQDGAFHFLEMNTRIQVEHPVTELVTGIDLVQWQFRIAAGDPLDFLQEDVRLRGHAVECRITAEDPAGGFLPATGLIRHLEVPAGPGVRWDGGIASGCRVGLHYDPLLGKLIVHAPTRPAALARMSRALDELVVDGVETCTGFLARVLREKDFRDGNVDVRYLEEHPELLEAPVNVDHLVEVAAVAAALEDERRRHLEPPRIAARGDGERLSAWRRAIQTWRDA